CQSQALLKIGETSCASEGVTNDEQRPPFADGIERACHGAQVGFEGFVLHSSSYLIPENLVAPLYQIWASISGCIMQPTWRKAGRSTNPLARAQMPYQSRTKTQKR